MNSYNYKGESLSDIAAPHFALRNGYQDCPFCNRPKKFVVKDDWSFRCYHPDCIAHNWHSGYDFAVLKGWYANALEASKSLNNNRKLTGKNWYERVKFLKRVFYCYISAIDDVSLEFANSRGWVYALEQNPIGYAPGSTYLQSKGFELKELIKYGLAYEGGNEFFRDRVIFPIHNPSGALIHLQGRSLDPDCEPRWLSTKSSKTECSDDYQVDISQCLFNIHNINKGDSVILTEGISDGYSALELQQKVVSSLGLEPKLSSYSKLLADCKELIAVYDNDKYPMGGQLQGKYKSWLSILPKLIELKLRVPQLPIYCCVPPTIPGVKDLNDWLNKMSLTKESFEDYLVKHKVPLEEFCINVLGDNMVYHGLLLKLISTQPVYKDIFRDKILVKYNDPLDYITELANVL